MNLMIINQVIKALGFCIGFEDSDCTFLTSG